MPPSHGLDRLCTADSHSSAPLTAPTPARILVTPCSSGSSHLFGDRHPAPHLLPPSPTGILTPRSTLPYVLPTHRHGKYLSGWLATSPPQGTEGRQALTQGRDSCCNSFTDTIVSTVVGNAWWSGVSRGRATISRGRSRYRTSGVNEEGQGSRRRRRSLFFESYTHEARFLTDGAGA